MSTPVTLTYLASAQKNAGGTSLIVTASQAVVSFSYILFSGDNANSSEPNVESGFINKNVNVGSDNCYLISGDGSEWTYHLFVEKSEVLCAYDYYAVVSALYVNGTQTPFQSEPVTIYLTPAKITLADGDVFISRVEGDYTDATVTVKFDEPDCLIPYDLTYIVAIQYQDINDEWKFVTLSGTYNTDIGGVVVQIVSDYGINENDTYVAIQGVRNITVNTVDLEAIGELSNTVLAIDTDKPQPPTDLTADYVYYTEPPTVDLTWNAPSSAEIITITSFKVHRLWTRNGVVLGNAYIATVPYVEGQTVYTYSDDVSSELGFQEGDVLTYYVVSYDSEDDQYSDPSNTVTVTIIQTSSAPVDFQATGVLEFPLNNEAAVAVTFQNPTTIGGSTQEGYEDAYFVINVYLTNESGALLKTVEVPYVADVDHVYSVGINNIAPVSIADTLYLTNKLITYDSNNPGELIVGQEASTTTQVFPVPFITNINGILGNIAWTKEEGVESFDVISYAPLTSPGITVLAYLNTGDIARTEFPIVDPILIPDPYGDAPFGGAYLYHYAASVLPVAGVALSITAANASGYQTRKITGSVN
jgi:hypothetical protein